MDPQLREELTEYLKRFVTPNKLQKIEKVLSWRTRHLTLILEDIFHSQNISAVIRTCECFGIQDFHVVEDRNPFIVNSNVTQGSSYWVDIFRYETTKSDNAQTQCLEHLRNQDYQIVATMLSPQAKPPQEIPTDQKLAFVFGNEEKGVSSKFQEAADYFLYIPMYGFTQSFNISVSAAIIISHFVQKLHSSKINWQLTEEEKKQIRLNWLRRILRKRLVGEKLEEKFLQEKKLQDK